MVEIQKFKICCPTCGFSKEVSKDKFPSQVNRVVCPKCKNKFELTGVCVKTNHDDLEGSPLNVTKKQMIIPKKQPGPIKHDPIIPKKESEVAIAIQSHGNFRKVCIKALSRRPGMYRGQGSILVGAHRITIAGRHVKSMGFRWGIGLLIMIFSLIFSGGKILVGIIPVYLLVEYVFLKREDVTISLNKLKMYAVDPKKKLIGLEFDGPIRTSPAIFRTEQFKDLITELRTYAPGKDATPSIVVR
jgi:hypothetical protein